MFKKILSLIFLLSLITVTFAETADDYVTIDSQRYNVTINSPISMSLNTNFKINPESIKIREQTNFEIVSGQAFIFRYDFNNKLDYQVIGRYELELGIKDLTQLKNIGVYISDALQDKDCVLNNGEILIYNNKRIEIIEENETKYLCSGTKVMDYYLDKDKLILDMILEPGTNSKYFLFVTTPTFSLVDSSFSFNDTIKLKNTTDTEFFNPEKTQTKEFGPITSANADNSSDLKELNAYNNQEKYNKINQNYNSGNIKTKEISTTPPEQLKKPDKVNINKFKEDVKSFKSKATGLITMTPTKWGYVLIGIAIIIIFGIFIINKKKRH